MDKEMFVTPDLGDTQLEAFHRLINRGSREEPNDSPGLEGTDQEIVSRSFGERYYIIEAFLNKGDAAYEPITYPSESYVPARLTRKRNTRVKKRTLYIGSTPSMSYQGTSVVNGIDRVTIHQISRSPGIYHKLARGHSGDPIYAAGTIISNWGGKSKIEPDSRNIIWARVRKRRKTTIQLLSLAMGSSAKQVCKHVCYPKGSNGTNESNAWSREHAISELYKLLYGTDEYPEFSDRPEEPRDKFSQPKFEIGEIGRINPNKKLDPDVPNKESLPLPRDASAAIDYSVGIEAGAGTTDDMDNPKNRRVRTAADLSQDQFRSASERPADFMRVVISRAQSRRVPTIRSLANSSPSLTTSKEFPGSHPLPQTLDHTNPSAQMAHRRKPSSLGPGGPARRAAGSQARDIHPSHHGRVCPIETPEGMNAGLISSSALHAGVDHRGYSASPFQRISGILRGEEVAAYYVLAEDEGYRITAGTALSVYPGGRVTQFTAARYRLEFVIIAWDHIHLRSIPPLQYPPVGAPPIPLSENNDANRTLMGSNMQRQAVPLLRSEKRIVGTGLEVQVAGGSSAALAPRGGKIDHTDGGVTALARGKDKIMDPTELVMYKSSNKHNCAHHKTGLRRDGSLRKGQITADGAGTEGGELALGRNISLAYMPWEGHNSEDSVLTGERPIFEGIHASIHIDKYEVESLVTLQGTAEVITSEVPHIDDYLPRHPDYGGLITPGSWAEPGDVLVGKPAPRRDPGESSIRAPESNLPQAIFGIDITTVRETRLKVPAGGRGRIIDVKWIRREDTSSNRVVHVYAPQKRETQVGDKVAGRHGNKGIIPKIMPRQDPPHPQDGTTIDMVSSPLGVPSRMNVGQIFERALGPAGHFLGRHHRIIPSDEKYERGAPRKLVYSEPYEASERTANPWLFELGNPGKSRLIDGRTGEVFERPITIGKAYMPKLVHQVDDKIHARSGGPYSRLTQQPLKGRSKQGGQRVGETEVRALEGFGVSNTLHEMPTMKPDHFDSRREVVSAIAAGEPVYGGPETTTPESLRLLVRELRCLAPDTDSAAVDKGPFLIKNG
uniref:DNA-directed RNA polymerase subunit beta n=1 Tax=Megaloselaginella exaltata TaxID=3140882 RepID=A0A7U3UCD5_9TRAC|nr:RNA polymerase beta subunit [Selaginella exaltata]